MEPQEQFSLLVANESFWKRSKGRANSVLARNELGLDEKIVGIAVDAVMVVVRVLDGKVAVASARVDVWEKGAARQNAQETGAENSCLVA